jgi:hypothetical protein
VTALSPDSGPLQTANTRRVSGPRGGAFRAPQAGELASIKCPDRSFPVDADQLGAEEEGGEQEDSLARQLLIQGTAK